MSTRSETRTRQPRSPTCRPNTEGVGSGPSTAPVSTKGENVTKLKFSDGEEFDTSGELRVETRKDGLYIVGEGFLISVDSREEADAKLRKMKARKRLKR
jgi:hypothetical protein